jgi:hypothetical protein
MWPTASSNAEPDPFGLGPIKTNVRLTARRLPPLVPQASQVGNTALIEREAVNLPLDHTFASSLPMQVRLQLLRLCRRANGHGFGGSPSRDRLGDGSAIHGDGLSHRVRPGCVVVGTPIAALA